jgi:uncharacterized repeat protein (TIGR01451 family)
VNSSPDTVTVTTLNSPPVANAGPDQSVTVGALVQLNGAASTDVDGNPLTYSWSFVSRPPGSAAVLSNPSLVNPTFTADKSGSYVVQLVVNDGTVNSAPDTAQITVSDLPQADIALTKSVNKANPSVGENVTFTVTVSNIGPAKATGVQVTDLLPSGYTLVSTAPSQGDYTAGSGLWNVGALNSGVSATLGITATVLTTGSYTNRATRTASTPADPNAANDSAAAVVTVKSVTTTAVSSSVNPAAVGQSVTFTATVSPAAATGTATFNNGASTLGTVTLSGGSATYSTSALETGAHSITVIYSGNGSYSGSTSPPIAQLVSPLVLPLVLISGTSQTFSLVQPAYAAAANGEIIKAQGISFSELLLFDTAGKTVTIKGGYEPTFSTQSGYTTIQGKLTIGKGGIVADRITIR